MNDHFLVIVGLRHSLAEKAIGPSEAAPRCREGADSFLVDAILEGHLEDSFGQDVIASCDGGSAHFAHRLAGLLVEEVLVSQTASIAFAIKFCGAKVRYLTPKFALVACYLDALVSARKQKAGGSNGKNHKQS